MNTNPRKNTTSFIGKLYCTIFGHRYRITEKITLHVSEYQCKQCRSEATNDDQGRITSLTPQLKDINETLRYIYKKKNHAY